MNTFTCICEFAEMIFTSLMNLLAFDSPSEGQIDANFISRYNEQEKDFDYYVQRLLGIDIENEDEPEKGRMWIPFINDKKENWTFICRSSKIVKSSDKVLWKYIYVNDNVT